MNLKPLILFLVPIAVFASPSRDYTCDVSDRSASSSSKTQTLDIPVNEIKNVNLEDGKHSLGFNNYDGALFTSFFEPGHEDEAIWISLDGRGLVLRLRNPLLQVYCHLK